MNKALAMEKSQVFQSIDATDKWINNGYHGVLAKTCISRQVSGTDEMVQMVSKGGVHMTYIKRVRVPA